MEQWFWSFFGVFLYNFLSFTIIKDKYDEKHKKFAWKSYINQRWDNWVWSLMCVPIVVIYGDQLFYYLMQYFTLDWEFYEILYLSAGVVAESLYFLLTKSLSIINFIGVSKK